MKTVVISFIALMLTAVTLQASAANTFMCWKSDEDLVHYVILEARESYHGFCYCPDDLDGFGNYCGKKSAYSRPYGVPVYCFPEDITPEMVSDYREEHCSTGLPT